MLLTEMAPPPGAQEMAGLRARARAARRGALVALTASIALLTTVQLLADRAATREQTLPLAVLSLALFVAALPAMALTQYAWGARARRVRRRERELYASTRSGRARPLTRLAVAACWAVTLLLGWTVPRLFRAAARYSFADALSWAGEAMSVISVSAGVLFLLWWARDVVGMLARALRSGDHLAIRGTRAPARAARRARRSGRARPSRSRPCSEPAPICGSRRRESYTRCSPPPSSAG
ncbi:hypothetical protein [[Actinomadura] parvosata]|nr:hypothetical protein [Nonomuraea sp. ATCC 55076]